MVQILPVFEDGIEIIHPAGRKQPHAVDHDRNASSGEGPPREPEQEDLIPRGVVVRQEAVCLADILGKSSPDLVNISSRRAPPRLVVYHLLRAVGALGQEGPADARDVGGDGEIAVRVLGTRGIAGNEAVVAVLTPVQ